MRRRVADEILDVVENLLRAQLAAVEDLRRGKRSSEKAENVQGVHVERKSQVTVGYEVLKRANRPLHVNELISLAKEWHGVSLDRDTLVSAISKKILRGDRFTRTGRNTFGLLGGDPES